MPTLIDYCLNSTFAGCVFQITTDIANTVGGGALAYLFFYGIIILSAVAGAIILKNINYGLMTFLVIHSIIIILGSISVIPLPAGYDVFGTVTYVVIVIALITAYRRK